MVLLEAMYFGLPVVSSDNGGASVLIKDEENGIIIDDFQQESWVQAIDNLIRDKEKYSIIKEKASQTIKERFLWSHLADKFLEAFEEATELFKNGESNG